jgi:hypothetical protein
MCGRPPKSKGAARQDTRLIERERPRETVVEATAPAVNLGRGAAFDR